MCVVCVCGEKERDKVCVYTCTYICVRVEEELEGLSAEEEDLHFRTLTYICIRVEEELEAERFR